MRLNACIYKKKRNEQNKDIATAAQKGEGAEKGGKICQNFGTEMYLKFLTQMRPANKSQRKKKMSRHF